MTTIEKIKAEIEKQIKDPLEYCYGVSSINKLRELLDFISTLESEKPNDLEDAAMNYIAPIENEYGLKVINFSGQDIKDSFIAGAKWQKEQMMKDGNVILAEEDFDAEKEKSVEWGYNLCKEQMMKGAVEGEVDFEYFGYKVIRPDLKQLDTLLESMNHGDKVRIIIVKED